MRRSLRLVLLVGLTGVMVAPLVASPASGKSTVDDVLVEVWLFPQAVPATTKTSSLNFKIGLDVASSSGVPHEITARISLPGGLRWGSDAPDPTEGCTGTAPAVCTVTMQSNPVGTVGTGWVWDVVAERVGFYEISATVESAEADPNLSNNSHTFRFEVTQASRGGGGPAGGGGGASVSASTVKLKPQKPKAGSVVTASVGVTAGGSPVRPIRLSCAGTVGGARLAGTPRPAAGKATCLYRTPKAARGKTLRGIIAFTAKGKKVSRRFAAKLG